MSLAIEGLVNSMLERTLCVLSPKEDRWNSLHRSHVIGELAHLVASGLEYDYVNHLARVCNKTDILSILMLSVFLRIRCSRWV